MHFQDVLCFAVSKSSAALPLFVPWMREGNLQIHLSLHMGHLRFSRYHFGVQIMRTIVFWGLHWGPLIWGNYHIGIMEKNMETAIMGYIGFRVEGFRV